MLFAGKVGGLAIQGISKLVQRIRDRRRRLHKGRWKNVPYDPDERKDRIQLQAQLKTDNEVIKLSNDNISYTPRNSQIVAKIGMQEGIIQKAKTFYDTNKQLVQIGSALVALWYMFTQTDLLTKKKSVKRKKRKAPRKTTTTRRATSTRTGTGKQTMPIKYRNGCKGKKGSELGKCLQYWRKYRKGDIKLK